MKGEFACPSARLVPARCRNAPGFSQLKQERQSGPANACVAQCATASLTAGENEVRRVRSSRFAERLFCGRCGTPLGIDYDIQPKTFDFSETTLDDAEPPKTLS